MKKLTLDRGKLKLERTSVYQTIRMLVNLGVLDRLDPKVDPPETHFSENGVFMLKDEIKIWNEIFKLTDEYDLLKPLIEIFSQRLDKINRYIQGSSIN